MLEKLTVNVLFILFANFPDFFKDNKIDHTGGSIDTAIAVLH